MAGSTGTGIAIVVAAVLATASAIAAPAAASDGRGHEAAAIRSQQAGIRAQAQAGTGRYAAMDASRRARLYHAQDRVDALLGDATWTGDLGRDAQIQLFNQLETISAIVNDEELERMECRYRRMTGSQRNELVCSSAVQLRDAAEAQQRAVIGNNLFSR